MPTDATPTDQKVLKDGTPTDQRIVVDTTPTDQRVLTGPAAVSQGSMLDNRWRLESCLASGGYGDVWAGVDTQTNAKIAVKILRTDAGNNDPSAIARMRQEAEILKAISHPNIVRVFGFGNSPYGHFMAMEFLEGQAIDQLMTRDGPAETERLIPMVRQLLGALGVAHEKQIFHRDLKPENIIVVRDQNGSECAKLVDFGIAKATRLLNDSDDGATLVQTRAGGFMGTPRYAAPEQAVGDPCGPNIDLFALGLVIAEWLTGRMRIDGSSHGEVMTQLLSPDELDISDVPYRWREWLSLMLKKNPRERFQTAEEALEQLELLVVQLHKRADFLEHSDSMALHAAAPAAANARSRPAASGFAANDGPLELDFERARKVIHTPHPVHSGERAQLMPQVARVEHNQGPGIVTRVLFAIAILIVTLGAIAVIFSALILPQS